MDIIEIIDQKTKINLSIKDITIFKKVLNEVNNSLLGLEFESRVGFSYYEINTFLNSITEEIQQSVQEPSQILISLDEVRMIKSIFSEVCYGINLPNIEEKLGIPRTKANEILSLLRDVAKNMSLNCNFRKKLESLPINVDSSLPFSHHFCLEAESFKVEFFFQALRSPINSLASFVVLSSSSVDQINFTISSIPRIVQNIQIIQMITELDNCLNDKNISQIKFPSKVFKAESFQFIVLDKLKDSENNELLILNFMLRIPQSTNNNIVFPYVGVQGAISAANVSGFTGLVRDFLFSKIQ
jgi:hypothetical protein